MNRSAEAWNVSMSHRHHPLLALLYARSVWSIATMELPRLTVLPPVGSSVPPTLPPDEVASRWNDLWIADEPLLGSDSPLGAVTAALSGRIDPEAYSEWSAGFLPDLGGVPLAAQPEFPIRGELERAWSRGLRHLVVLPFDERWLQRRGSRLLLSVVSYQNAEAYKRAIVQFGDQDRSV